MSLDPVLIAATTAALGATATAATEQYRRQRVASRSRAHERLLANHRLESEYSELALSEQPDLVQSDISNVFRHLGPLRPRMLVSSTSGRYVVEAFDERSRSSFIVKFSRRTANTISASTAQALFNESFILSHLNGGHAPRLSQVVALEKYGPAIVRESVPGVTSDRIVLSLAESGAPPSLREVKVFLGKVADAVEAIHNGGVVHGDIKPANIVGQWNVEKGEPTGLANCGPLSLIDFESSTLIEESPLLGRLRGTPRYMAPERYAFVRGSRASDVFSCSALASFLLTGRPERPGGSAGRRIISVELRHAIRRGLSVNLLERQQSVREWSDEINRGFAAIGEDTLGEPVDWPKSAPAMREELSKEAMTVTLRPFTRIRDGVDLSTVDGLVFSEYSDLNDDLRSVIDLLWYEKRSIEEIATKIGWSVDRVEKELATFLEVMEEAIRDSVVRSRVGRFQ